ncbi:hypothetical protein ABIC32_001382 [Brevundimonas sp. 1080]|uniref:hypothetical protein n=1 Tax=Brevundimonas sp. 1080 TaxID=3156405 RepID=UPI0033934769
MTKQDAIACRRALREVREIAAVALLDGAQTSIQEALQTIAAIAGWATEETDFTPPDCGEVLRCVDAMIGREDIETMDDRTAITLFRNVMTLLQKNRVSTDPAPPP